MPVEIRELIIRATTNLNQRDAQNTDSAQRSASSTSSQIDQELIVQEAVKQVLRILEKSKER